MENKLKLSRNVILVSPDRFGSLSVYPEYKLKEAENLSKFYSSRVSDFPKDVKLITLPNRGFKLFFRDIRSKSHGSVYKFRIYHPQFEEYEGWGWNESTKYIYLDSFNLDFILTFCGISEGEVLKSFSLDTFSGAWSSEAYRVIIDNHPLIEGMMKNYDEYYCKKSSPILKPGNIYLDRHGNYIFALTGDLFGRICGNGHGDYLLHRSWCRVCYGDPKKMNIILTLDGSILPKSIETLSELENFFNECLVKSNKYGLGVKKKDSGSFVKIQEVNGYSELYEKIGWKSIRETIYTTLEKTKNFIWSATQYNSFKSLASLSLTDESRDPVLSDKDRERWKSLIKYTLNSMKTSPAGYRERTIHSYFTSPISKDPLNITQVDDILESAFSRISYSSLLSGKKSSDWVISMGIYKDMNELIKDIDDIRFKS